MHRDIASPLFFLPLKLGGHGLDLLFNDMRLLHGVRGSRSFLH